MLNRVILMGRITAAPELKQTQSGLAVTSFSIAVDRNYKSAGQERAATDFINIVAWRQTAEFICKYFTKGSLIAIEGSIETRHYEDKNGNKRTAVEVIAERAHFTGEKKGDGGGGSGIENRFNEPAPIGANISVGDDVDFEVVDGEDELPF
ncbi:MAG: single-stranded DNA-binding protein [Oscillospiraceae bacterium]|nr:single-stranded DNA-binding protein [Oscillospiraceae bacterium]